MERASFRLRTTASLAPVAGIAISVIVLASVVDTAAGTLPPLTLKPTTVWYATPTQLDRLPSADVRVRVGTLVKKNFRVLPVRCIGNPTRCYARGRLLCTTGHQCEGAPVISHVMPTRLYRDVIPWQLLVPAPCLGILADLDAFESALTDDATDAAPGCDTSQLYPTYGQFSVDLIEECGTVRAPALWQQEIQEYCELVAAQLACVAEPSLIGTASTTVVQGQLEDLWQDAYDNCCEQIEEGVTADGATSLGCP